MNKRITIKQNELLEIIESSNPQPSITEIAEHFSVSRGAIFQRIQALIKKGIISRKGHRAIEILKRDTINV